MTKINCFSVLNVLLLHGSEARFTRLHTGELVLKLMKEGRCVAFGRGGTPSQLLQAAWQDSRQGGPLANEFNAGRFPAAKVSADLPVEVFDRLFGEVCSLSITGCRGDFRCEVRRGRDALSRMKPQSGSGGTIRQAMAVVFGAVADDDEDRPAENTGSRSIRTDSCPVSA